MTYVPGWQVATPRVYPPLVRVQCPTCGPVDTTDASTVRHLVNIVSAIEAGHAPLAAVTCPKCQREVRAKAVTWPDHARFDAEVRR